MTRLDSAGEPSMEDILASIRRIIAEDPPGSRPEVPQAPRPPMAPAPAAALPSQIVDPVRPDPVFTSRSPDLDFPRMSPTGKREVEAIPVMTSAEADNGSLDNQLADVLGTVRSAVARSEARAPLAHEPNPSAAAVQAALDSLIPAKADAPAINPAPFEPPLPRFTFTRDGFDPAMDSSIAATEAPADPFEFSLGPSPFARAPANERAEPVKADRPADPFGSLVPSRDVLQVQAPSEPVPAPVAPVQPPLSALRAAFAPAAEPAWPVVPEPAPAPAPSAFVPAAPVPQAASVPPASQEPAYRPLQAPSLGEIATAQPEPPAYLAAEAPLMAPPSAGFSHPVPPPSFAPAVAAAELPVAAPVFAPPPAAEAPAAPPPPAEPEAPAAAAEPLPAIEPVSAILDQIAAAQPAPAAAEPVPAIAAPEPPPAAEVVPPAPAIEEPVALQPLSEAVAEPQMPAVEAVFEEAHAPEREAAPVPESQLVSQQALVSAHQAAQAGAQDSAVPRTMEDTVAELLRPMLRNWLAENMPRIVERALRKELDESSRSEHKPAAE